MLGVETSDTSANNNQSVVSLPTLLWIQLLLGHSAKWLMDYHTLFSPFPTALTCVQKETQSQWVEREADQSTADSYFSPCLWFAICLHISTMQGLRHPVANTVHAFLLISDFIVRHHWCICSPCHSFILVRHFMYHCYSLQSSLLFIYLCYSVQSTLLFPLVFTVINVSHQSFTSFIIVINFSHCNSFIFVTHFSQHFDSSLFISVIVISSL